MRHDVRGLKSRTKRVIALLVATVIFALIVIQVPGIADKWSELSASRAKSLELRRTYAEGLEVDPVSLQLTQVEQQLNRFQAVMVDGDQMSTIQSELMASAEKHGCQLKKAVLAPSSMEIWEPLANRDLTGEVYEADLELDPEEKHLELTTNQLDLRFEGSLAQAFAFLGDVRSGGRLMKIAQVGFSRDASDGDRLKVDANIAFFKLTQEISDWD